MYKTKLIKSLVVLSAIAVSTTTAQQNGDVKFISGIECVYVAPGTFQMGQADILVAMPVRQVTLTQGYWIGKYPVTQAQYQSVMGTNPSSFSGDNKPVERVTWHNAVDFCGKVGGRLPTEAEWEFAARGGNKSNGYTYSGSNNLDEVGWYRSNSGYEIKPVGQKKANELGLYDMTGNVSEICNDGIISKEDVYTTYISKDDFIGFRLCLDAEK
jgi:formylglycine-generating enzyme required for sulfatase activity